MREQRWPWLLTAALMLASAAAAVWSTYLHWLPCRGSMLSGSIVRGYAYGPDFSEACLRRMDGGLPFPYPPEPAEQAPWASELGVAATALAGLAWLTLVFLGLRWSLRIKAVAALPGLATCVVAVVAGMALTDAARNPDDFLPMWLWWSIDGFAFIALMILTWKQDVRGPGLLRLLVVLWGTTAFGGVHWFFHWMAMLTFSDASWDVPPGAGYLTGAPLIISVILTVIMTLLPLEPVPPSRRTRAAVSARRL